jgi:pimeloyl-ACP methyl ester carboxylesterase
VERSETRYARSGEVSIAYQVVGDGPFDLVYVPGFVSNIELMWEEPGLARFLERLASFSRLILFDKRGTGLSDPVPNDGLPTLEERMDDVRAVMDAVGSKRAALLGHSEGGNMCVLFSATHPERTTALLLVGSYAKRIRSEDYPWAPTVEERAREIEETEATWGSPEAFRALAPSKENDPDFQRWIGRYLRQSASPKAAAALLRMNTQIDVRNVLPTIGVPTLLLYRTHDADVHVDEGRYIAERIPGSTFVELPGADHLMWTGDADALLDEVEGFLTGVRRGPDPDRVLATVLFTDVVGSTETATRVGDRAWRSLLERHHQVVRRALARWRGREIDTAGDGFLATFDGPARAIRCAVAASEGVRDLGLQIRAGLHTGEVEIAGEDVRGIAVHIGSRVAALAGPDEVLVSRTVADLVAGSGIVLAERGEHELKGVSGTWLVYAVESV